MVVLVKLWILRKEYKKRDALAKVRLWSDMPFVSVIVPGKNEGENIHKLTCSLREQTYQNFEIIVVDDGSDDQTPIICRSLERCGFIDKFVRQEVRGGKASAANLALHDTQSQIIVHIDADSSLDRDAIEELLIPFYWGKNVGAVGGCVKVRNGNESICARMQELEYLETILVGRTVTSELNIYRTVSGAFGAFRKDVLDQVGNWDVGPGLDGDITQKIRKSGYKIAFARKAICLTSSPVAFYNLFKQRLRWSKSLVRFRVRKHKNVLDFRYASFNFYNFASNIDNIMFNLVFDVVWLIYILGLVAYNSDYLIELFILKFIVMLPLGLLSYMMIMVLSERRSKEAYLLSYVPLQTLYSGYFLRFTRILAMILELFFFSSYKDSWNPYKASRQARYGGM